MNVCMVVKPVEYKREAFILKKILFKQLKGRRFELLTMHLGFLSFIFLDNPVRVPPVPVPHTTMSTFPENSNTLFVYYQLLEIIDYFKNVYCFKF